MNRRDFIKRSAQAGSIALGASVVSKVAKPIEVSASGLGVKYHDNIDQVITVDKSYKRFDQKNTGFNLSGWGSPNPFSAQHFKTGNIEKYIKYPIEGKDNMDPTIVANIKSYVMKALLGKPKENAPVGYRQIDYAYTVAGRSSVQLTGSIFALFSSGDSGMYMPMPKPDGSGFIPIPQSLYHKDRPGPMDFKVAPTKHKFDSKKQATYAIKKASKTLGADLVGIAPFDERWVYNTEVYAPVNQMTGQIDLNLFNKERPIKFDFEPKSVIVFAFEMDYEVLKTSPSITANVAADYGYSRMLNTSLSVANFIRGMGYNALHAGNNIGLNVPLGIQAGLGEASRMGLLVTEEFGPRVRIAKVYTDLELDFDKPKTFGVKEFCEVCMKCADVCPSEAITRIKKTTDPENKAHNRCSNSGVDKWHNDYQKCTSFWSENGKSCANCISACPYNKLDEWHHDLAKIATKIPVANKLARYLDEAFGYGKVDSEKLMEDYWRKDI